MSIPKQEPKFPYMQIPLLNPTHLLFIRQENNKGELYNKNWGIHPSGVSSHYKKNKANNTTSCPNFNLAYGNQFSYLKYSILKNWSIGI